MNQTDFDAVQSFRRCHIKFIFTRFQIQPGWPWNKAVDDICHNALTLQKNGFVACFRGDRDDVAFLNIAWNLHIFARQSVVDGRIFCRSAADFKSKTDLITAVVAVSYTHLTLPTTERV